MAEDHRTPDCAPDCAPGRPPGSDAPGRTAKFEDFDGFRLGGTLRAEAGRTGPMGCG